MDQEVRVEVTKMLDVSICSGQSDLINQLDSHLHEFLRATNIKHQQMAMDTIVREMSKLQIITDDKEEELKAWDMFILVICKIYANCKESTKISKTILKVVKQLYRLFPDRTQTMFDEEVTSLWFRKQETLSNGTLQRVSIMIDECEMMKKFLENNLRVFIASLSRIMMGYCICSDVVDVASCQVSTKICLQTIQLHPHISEKIIWKDSEDEMKDHTKDIITCLLMIIFSKRFSQECSLLAGSAVGLLINTAQSQEDAMATAVNLLKLTMEVTPERRLEFGKLSVSFGVDDNISNHAFPTLVLLKAMLTCLDKKLLVADVMLEGKKVKFLFDVLFPEVCKVCKNVTKVQFHSFQVLMLWLQCVRNSIHQVYRDQTHPSRVFTKDCKYTTTVLQLVWENWENPIDGVVDCIKTSFSELLEIYSEESRLCKEVDNTFYDDLSVRLVNTPWHVKGKYGPLCSLISYIGAAKFLTAHPEVASSLVSCLATNYLAPPACEVYKTFLQNLRKECSASSEDSLAEYWSLFLKSHLLAALCHETQLLRHNASHYWLPWTLKIFPAAHEMLITELSNNPEKFSPTRCLHAQIGVLNVARNLKIINGCDLQPEPICQALWHLDDDVRSDAVGLLCNSHKKSEPLSELECRLLKEFLPINLNCDSSRFRQHLYAYTKRLVVRIRDSCIAILKQNLKEKKGRQPPSVDSSTPRTVEMSVDFVDWLFDLSVSSLFPGSCYQRRKTSLELILAILESLITGDGIARRKGQTPDSAGLLMDWANGCKKWMFFSQRNASIILSCMEDGTNEIRELAYSILAVYFPWPLACLTTECPKFTAHHILQQSYHLLCSPKAMESESGAIMCKLVFQKYVAEMGWKFTMKLHSPEEISINVDTKPTEGDSRICFVKELQEQLMQQYEAAKRNLLKAATTSPLHGILLALRRCLTENNITTAMTTNDNSDDLKSVIGQILETVETIVNAMLQVLFGKSANPDSDVSPDFAEMGIAIGQVISESLGEDGSEHCESAALSTEHQLILAFCWLNIKECSLLLGAFANSFPFTVENSSGLLTTGQIQKMADIFVKILTKCRHRGAIEGCHIGFMKLCTRLLSSPFPELSNIPKNILAQVFSLLESPRATSSITRRSAGLPLLVEAITSCEPKGREKQLLKYSMDHLLKTVHKSLPDDTTQTMDLPQVHGFNILKSLFRSAVLGNAMLQYASQVVIVTIQGFSSPSWAIRNACTQLFGTLVARMLGQKRTQDEHSQLNTITAQEFFVRYPRLHSFLLSQVLEASEFQQDNQLCLYPALHPVLTVLSKLGPGIEHGLTECSQSKFIEPVTKLSASPIYAVRVLAATALLPLVTLEQHGSYLDAILDRLPERYSEVTSHNALHGMLLQIDKLLQTLLTDNRLNILDLKIHAKLNRNIWLASPENPCALTRALYLNIVMRCLRHATDFSDINSGCELLKNLHKDIKEVVPGEDEEQCFPVQIGDAVLKREKVKSIFELTVEDEDRRKFLVECFGSEDSDIRLSALQDVMENFRSKNEHFFTADFLIPLVIGRIASENEHSCLKTELELFVEISEEADLSASALSMLSLSDILVSLANGYKGTTLSAVALPVLAITVQHQMHSDCYRNILDDLVILIEKYSKPTIVEDLRLAVARVLQITGPQLICAISHSKKEELIPYVTRIFISSVQLLQDEVQEVRVETAKYAAMLPRPGDFVEYPSLHCNAGLQLLFMVFFESFTWSEVFLDFMLSYLIGDNSADKVIEEHIGTSSVHLFEQEDANIYAEHVMTVQLANHHLQRLVSNGIGGMYFRKFTPSRLQKATHMLKVTVNAIESNSNKGHGLWGVLGVGKPFLAVYRILLYSDLLLSVLGEFDDWDQRVTDAAKELISTLRKFHKIPSVHPLLKDHYLYSSIEILQKAT